MTTSARAGIVARELGSDEKVLSTGKVENLTDRFAPVLLGLLFVYTFIRALVAATGKLYWYDELLTRLVVSQKTWAGMMSAIRAPVDTQPPLFYFIERLVSALIHNQELALRLPSAIAMACTVLSVFLYLRRARGADVALLGALFCLTTVQFTYYAQEARPYSLLVACTAFALVCYQRSDKMIWVILLAATLALAEAIHYLAVLMMVPFGLAEAYRIYATRQIRWGVWMALGAGMVPLLPSWGILVLNQRYYGPNHFSQNFSFMDISHLYGDFFALGTPLGTAVAATLVVGLLAKTTIWRQSREADQREIHETILIVALISLPFIGYVFAKVVHGGLLVRYVLPAVVGLALALGVLLSAASKRTVFLFGVFLISALALREIHFWRYAASDRETAAAEASTTGAFILSGGHTDLPVVVLDGNILRMALDGFPVDHRRIFFLITKNHTLDKGMKYVARFVPVQVRDEGEFLAHNSSFLFFVEGPDPGLRDFSDRLLREGWAVEHLATDRLRELNLIHRREQ